MTILGYHFTVATVADFKNQRNKIARDTGSLLKTNLEALLFY